MNTENLKLGNERPISSSPTLGVVMGWIDTQVSFMTDDEFWAWLMKLHEDGLNKDQEESIVKRAKINENFVPADFLSLLRITIDKIITFNHEAWSSRGYDPTFK